MNKFTFTLLSVTDVIVIEPKIFEDNRGFFTETYNKKEFTKAGEILASLKAKNKKIVGYGAPAKGSTLLNFYGINWKTLDCVIV